MATCFNKLDKRQRITKIHFKDETFELRIIGKKGSETSFFFQMSDRSDCKRLWRSCVEHHVFFRMSNPLTHKLKHNRCSVARSPTLPWLKVGVLRNKTFTKQTSADSCMRPKQHSANQTVSVQTAPPAVQRSVDWAGQDQVKPSAPWENSSPLSGLFNPRFPPKTKEEDQDGVRPQRRSRSLDGDGAIRRRGRRSRFHGNTSSGSESEKTASDGERCRRKSKNRQSPDVLTWKHIQKQLVEPDGWIDRQMEEIPYTEVRVSEEPITARRSPRRRRHRRWVSASEFHSKVDLVPPLPVTKATDTLCRLPTRP